MGSFFRLPANFGAARPMLEKMLLEHTFTATRLSGSRRRPQAPRDVRSQAGSLEMLITWVAPADLRGIVGWHIWEDNENILALTIDDPVTRQVRMKVPANTNKAFYVSAFNAQGIDSVKMPVIGKANTDQYVTSGTGGGTGGSSGSPPPEWPSEPRGGFGKINPL